MSNDINLLQNSKVTVSVVLQKRIRLIRMIALICLFTIPTIAIILSLMIFFSPLPALDQQKNALLNSNESLKGKAVQLAYINDRMVNAKNLIATRPVFDKVLDEVITSLPDNIKLDSLSIDSTGVLISLDSPSLDSLKSYQSKLTDDAATQHLVKKIGFQNIDLGTNTYELSLRLTVQ